MGMDVHAIWSAAGIPAISLLPRLLCGFFRREAFCNEGRIATHGRLHAAAIIPQLVPAALPVRVRHFPLRGGLTDGHVTTNGTCVCPYTGAFRIHVGNSCRPQSSGTKRAAFEISLRRSGFGALRRDLPAAGIRIEPRGHAVGEALLAGHYWPSADPCGSGGARKRQRSEDALAAGRPFAGER